MNTIGDVIRLRRMIFESLRKHLVREMEFTNKLLLDRITLDNRVIDLERQIHHLKAMAARPRR